MRQAHRNPTRRLVRLCAKELREILRDRRTIITLVLMPLLVYPILTLTFNTFLFSSFQSDSVVQPIVGFESEESFDRFRQWYAEWSRRLENEIPLEAEENEPELQFVANAQLRKQVGDGAIDLGVVLKPSRMEENSGSRRVGPQLPRFDVELVYREGSPTGAAAARYFQRRFENLNRAFDNQLLATSLPVRQRDVKIKTDTGIAFSFASFVPLMLILMTITGAVYPAIDLTAGERERGTMEALIAAPIPRVGLLLAKYVAVVLVAILTATANLFAMTVTLISSQLGDLLFGEGGISLMAMVQVYSLMVLFAAFFSAILLALTSFARSFKEAQAYLIPLMLLSLGPGIISLMPDIEMTPLFAVIPLLNMVLLARDTIQGNVDSMLATAAVLSTLVYAVAAISLAAKIFGTDAILYGSEASWTDLVRRSPEKSKRSSVAGAMVCLALLFPLQFVAASVVSRFGATSPSTDLAIEAPAELVSAARSRNAPVLVAGVPQGAELNVGRQVAEGTWRIPADELDRIRLRAAKMLNEPTELRFVLVGSNNLPQDQTEIVRNLSPRDLSAGVVVGSKTLTVRLITNAILTLLLFVVVPLLAAGWQSVRLSAGFRLHQPSVLVLPGALLMGISLWPFAHEIVVWGLEFGIGSLEGKMQAIDRLIAEFQEVPPWLVLVTMAITPGVCEEFFFRGFLMQSLLSRVKPWQAIVVSSVLFGAFHLIGSGVLAPERFLPSTFLGLFLGWVCYRTGSVLPGMLLHACHNGLLLMVSYYRDALIARGWNVEESSHLPFTWLLTAFVIAGLGLLIVHFLSQPRRDDQLGWVETSSSS